MKVTISMDDNIWKEFRGECIKKDLVASHLIDEFIEAKLFEWGVVQDISVNTIKKCIICDTEFIPKTHVGSALFCSIKCRNLYKSRERNPSLKEDYFKNIDTKEKAYWLGFILAIGNIKEINKGRNLEFCFKLRGNDGIWVERFMNAVGVEKDKKFIIERKGFLPYTNVFIGNRIFCENLLEYGDISKKFKNLKLPDFKKEELDLALLLGYFDGNGEVYEGRSPRIKSYSYITLEYLKEKYNLPYNITKRSTNLTAITLGWEIYKKMLDNYKDSLPRKRLELPESFANRHNDGRYKTIEGG